MVYGERLDTNSSVTLSFHFVSQRVVTCDIKFLFVSFHVFFFVLQLLKQQENHGIMYEYTIPMPQTEASSNSVKSSRERDRKPNRTKPEVKVKAPLSLAGAEDPMRRPADEGTRPSDPINFQPELSDKYQKYGTKFANYLLGGGTSSSQQSAAPRVAQPRPAVTAPPSQGGTGYGVLDVSQRAGNSHKQPADARAAGRTRVAPQPAVPNPINNRANGHRLRHRGRHGGRKIISAYRPNIQKQYDYQASSLGQTQTQGEYVYPPVAGVVPSRPVPPVQSSSQMHYTYQQQQQRQSYNAQRPQYASQYSGQQQYLGHNNRQLQHRYDNIYNYPGVQQQRSRWTLNDQIAVNLPGAQYPVQGNLDTGSDYTWRISGFTECSRTCGGGKSPYFSHVRGNRFILQT